MDLKRGIDASVVVIVEEMKKLATPTKGKEEIAQVGTDLRQRRHRASAT